MSSTKINWFPGHMKKTIDMIKENMKLIDVVLELVDARIPLSSRNPELKKLSNNKKSILIMNKCDLVKKEELDKWKKYFVEREKYFDVIGISALNGENIKELNNVLQKLLKEKTQKMEKKGVRNTTLRIMIGGIPNVGKSMLINYIVGKKVAGVGNRPGFTKGKQWIKIKKGVELLDTPGILWPRFEDEDIAAKLAITGAIKEEIFDSETICFNLIKRMKELGSYDSLISFYNIDKSCSDDVELVENVASRRKMLKKNGVLDLEKAYHVIIEDFRKAKLGRLIIDILN